MFKKIIFLLVLSSCLNSYGENSKACIEIGSGVTTLYIFEDELTKPLVYTEKVPFAKDLINNSNQMSEAIKEKALLTLENMKQIAYEKNATIVSVIATESFRAAANGDVICNYLKENTNLPIKILSKQEESKLGFITASIISNIDKEQLLAVDMGSGSFQVAFLNKENQLIYESEPLGTSFGVNAFKKLFQREAINPVSYVELQELLNNLDGSLNRFFSIKPEIVTQNKQVAGIGFVALVAIGMKDLGIGKVDELNQKNCFSKDDLKHLLNLLIDKNTSETTFTILTRSGAIWKDPAIPSLALLYAIMHHLHINEINCSLNEKLVGNGPGIISDFADVNLINLN